MSASFLLGLLLGMTGALLMNVGKGVQKQKVHVFLQGRAIFAKSNRRDLFFWVLGFFMTAGATLPYSLGLKLSGSPSTISATTGIGLIGLVVYAVKVIGEKMTKRDLLGISMVVLSTSILGYLGASGTPPSREFVRVDIAKWVLLLIALAACSCIVALFWQRIHGLAFGLTAGMCIGVAIFLGDAAILRAGGSFTGQFSNPYPYVALGFAVSATVITQIGFIKSRAIEVVPAVNSATILTPLILEVAIYPVSPPASFLALIIVILAGVFLLSTGAAAAASG